MDWLDHILKAAPEIALFAALFFGYAVGHVKIKGFSLGGVAGTLAVALVLGQLDIALPDALKAVCFALFIYSVGFQKRPRVLWRPEPFLAPSWWFSRSCNDPRHHRH